MSTQVGKVAAELMAPFTTGIDLERAELVTPCHRVVRRASDMRGHYADAEALEVLIAKGDPVHYEVFEILTPETRGNLSYCISKLYPGVVGEECFMTKGHYHTVAQTAELYLALRGEGIMLMKTAEGKVDTQKMVRGNMVYVPGYWAHRSINTGTEPLVSLCIYPAEAGHNYGDIETQGFPRRIYKRDGQIVMA
jgi:glucose-6-phosphate isomerase